MGGISQCLFDTYRPILGASAAVNAMLIFSVLQQPTATYLLMGIVPAPAWLVGLGFLAYDLNGAAQVCNTACSSGTSAAGEARVRPGNGCLGSNLAVACEW